MGFVYVFVLGSGPSNRKYVSMELWRSCTEVAEITRIQFDCIEQVLEH